MILQQPYFDYLGLSEAMHKTARQEQCPFCGRFMKKCPNDVWTCQHSKPFDKALYTVKFRK